MSKYLGSLVLVLLGVACGGTTDTGDAAGGGTSQGGANAGGHDSGGSVSSAGKASGGDSATGGSGGSINVAGSIGNGGASGGSGTVDPRCPAERPMGACMAADSGLACQYDNFTNCLCYSTAPGTFTICQKVDPTCPSSGGAAGVAGAGGGVANMAGAAGTGGVSAKIALPPHLICSCTGSAWNCTYGI